MSHKIRLKTGALSEVHIHDIGFGGDGVGRLPDGRVVFVPHTAVGDRVRVRLGQVRKKLARDRVEALLEPGPGRIQPRCPVAHECGGCQYQHLDAATELAAKEKQLRDVLERIGGLRDLPAIEVVDSPRQYHYRNKIQLHPVGDGRWGYVAEDGGTVVPVSHCDIAHEAINATMTQLPPAGVEPHFLRAEADATVHVTGRTRPEEPPLLTERLFGRPIAVPLGSFYQVNPPVLRAMVDWLRALQPALGGELLVDAYCGVGVFALALGDRYREVFGVEADPRAIATARHNARTWGYDHLSFRAADAAATVGELPLGPDSTVLLDPPRNGCGDELPLQLLANAPRTLVYIACDPTTLARDLACLQQRFTLRRLALFNMFPRTAHFESVAVLQA